MTEKQQAMLRQCEESIKKGRKCQLCVTPNVVSSEKFQTWLFNLYKHYPAKQLSQQLCFVDQGDVLVKPILEPLLQVASLSQLLRVRKEDIEH